MDGARTKFQMKMDALSKYMKYRQLPDELTSRIDSFYEYQWQLRRGLDEKKFLSDLPRTLQQHIVRVMRHDLLRGQASGAVLGVWPARRPVGQRAMQLAACLTSQASQPSNLLAG